MMKKPWSVAIAVVWNLLLVYLVYQIARIAYGIENANYYVPYALADTYLVYPDGSSIRFERLIEGIQAYEKVRLLRPSLNLKGAKDLDEMLRYFAPNTYEKDKDPVALLRQANDLIWKLSK